MMYTYTTCSTHECIDYYTVYIHDMYTGVAHASYMYPRGLFQKQKPSDLTPSRQVLTQLCTEWQQFKYMFVYNKHI